MSDSKRKQPSSRGGDAHPAKRSKGGKGAGAWQTPQHKAKVASLQDKGVTIGIGDKGIWVTFARGMDAKAISEFNLLCDEYGKTMYNIAPPDEDVESDNEAEDIEDSIKKELEGISGGGKSKSKRNFKAIKAGIECVFFMKTRDPVDPVELCRRICQDASLCTDLKERKTKYINRLTPVTFVDKASENGVARVARKALAAHFELTMDTLPRSTDSEITEGPVETGLGKEDVREQEMRSETPREAEKPAFTVSLKTQDIYPKSVLIHRQYAIRPSIRSNSSLDRDKLISQIAKAVNPRHKVNLTNPDKVVLVDVFQSFCGMSVIERSDWDGLKKLNVNELYKASPGAKPKDMGAEASGEGGCGVLDAM
ncbi:THUMP domain-containing protein [Colletotrichum graminicola]|uniref:THUMP domain-containing protein n=1 Tax=Colletotrichum graminicola (strain M1.001 / M2 / FGSC 10212) TaxID=645133 RepID=E3QLS9_COLGM|nr:THUMP domain-containing protein [Colletotrichum graminicola M1.001]EFQ31817.1 THUMP domain-containing protein [Colletotrichum graminicola M1.001]WDK13582.1 THUMP domain-containing protein [Colletotrichum graminicola]